VTVESDYFENINIKPWNEDFEKVTATASSNDYSFEEIQTNNNRTAFAFTNGKGIAKVTMQMGENSETSANLDSELENKETAFIILAVIIVIATLGLLYMCIKRKQKNDTTFIFENNQDYGALK